MANFEPILKATDNWRIVEPRPEWHARKLIAAGVLQTLEPGQTVLELGCWDMALRELLPAGVQYVGSDLHRRKPYSAGSIVCNLNASFLPLEPWHDCAALVVLGVLEYLEPGRAEALLHWSKHQRVVLSYGFEPAELQTLEHNPQSLIAAARRAGLHPMRHFCYSEATPRRVLFDLARIGAVWGRNAD